MSEGGEECYAAGMACLESEPQDLEGAAVKFQEAADLGHVEATFKLAVMYEGGYGVTEDVAKSVEYFRKAAEGGHVDAQTSMGDAYRKGKGVPKDSAESAKWYKEAAKQGHELAQFNVAIAYENGLGLEKDLSQAAYWYQKAAEQGNPDAQHNLGYLYLTGDGVTKSLRSAMAWFERAAEKGNELSQNILDQIYEADRKHREDLERLEASMENKQDSYDEDEELYRERYDVKMVSTATKTTRHMEKSEKRLHHLLICKGVKYDYLDMDRLDKERVRELQKIAPEYEIPQVHVRGKCIGDYQCLQELEDAGQLDDLLNSLGVVVKADQPNHERYEAQMFEERIRRGDCSTFEQDPFIAYVADSKVLIKWEPQESLRSGQMWVLLLNGEPHYRGSDKSDYIYTHTGERSEVVVLLRRVPKGGDVLTDGVDEGVIVLELEAS
eukprot:c13177_g1_i1.p1 GENE.c13177_g1_i1~~c13177_g1_i1.p1  ORF type:complete len:439 (+),score=107.83 c13177_g1_i1:31-1347(+)